MALAGSSTSFGESHFSDELLDRVHLHVADDDPDGEQSRQMTHINALKLRIETQTRDYSSLRFAADAFEEEAEDLKTRLVESTVSDQQVSLAASSLWKARSLLRVTRRQLRCNEMRSSDAPFPRSWIVKTPMFNEPPMPFDTRFQ